MTALLLLTSRERILVWLEQLLIARGSFRRLHGKLGPEVLRCLPLAKARTG